MVYLGNIIDVSPHYTEQTTSTQMDAQDFLWLGKKTAQDFATDE